MKFKLLSLMLSISILLILANPLIAQTSRGTVAGIISDEHGAIIQGALITLTNNVTTINRTTSTNNEGIYVFEAVELGDYTLKVEAPNFSTVVITSIQVNANQTFKEDVQLLPKSVTVTTNITTESESQLQFESPVRGGNFSDRQILNLPFSTRNPVSLATTLPGVVNNRFGTGSATFSVNGVRQRDNNFLIDGTENNDISVGGQSLQITNPDAIQEVSIQTSNYDAEFGRSGGAIINVITKSGTNNFHGTLSYLLDSTRDDAITNTQALNPEVQQRRRPLSGTEQWFSGTFGGPLLIPRFGEGGNRLYNGKGKSFFFYSFQEQHQNSISQSNVITLSPQGRSALRSFFPLGRNPRVDTLLGLTNNINATSQFFSQELGLGRPSIQFGTAISSFPQTLTDRQQLIRIDHNIGSKDQLSGRYLYGSKQSPTASASSYTFPNLITSGAVKYQNIHLTETHIFSTNLTNEVRLGYNRSKISFPLDPQSEIAKTLPVIVIPGISSAGPPGSTLGVLPIYPQKRIANNYIFQNSSTYLFRRHTFRFGLDLLNQRSRQDAPIIDRGALVYEATNIQIPDPRNPLSRLNISFSPLANYIDDFGGTVGVAARDFGNPTYYPNLFRQAYFFHDRWRATNNLTMTLGLRYENFGTPFNSLRTPAFTGLFNVDPVTFAGSFDKHNKIPSDNNNFAPILGIAYSPIYRDGILGKLVGERLTVLRAGYRIGYTSFLNLISNSASTASPNLVFANTISIPSASRPRGLSNFSTLVPNRARPVNPLDAQNNLMAPNLVNPYYQQWTASIQRLLPGNLLLDIAYVGSKGTKLYLTEDLNPAVPETMRITPSGYRGTMCVPGTPGCRLSGRLDNLQGPRVIRTNGGSSIYHAGQLNVNRRFINGFSATASYTWSKFIDNGSDVVTIGTLNALNLSSVPSIFGGLKTDRSVSTFDRPHKLSFTYTYEIPIMKDQRGLLGKLVGGFIISGITTFESGVPLNIVNGFDADGIGENYDRPDFNPLGIPRTRAVPDSKSPTGYINPDNNNAPIDPKTAQYIALPSGIGRTGNLGRNTFRTPGLSNWDVNILKRVPLSERVRLEFRTEVFNLFNHPQPGTPSVSPFAPGQQGMFSNVATSPPGRFLNTTIPDAGGRVIRYQLKLIF